MCLASVYVETPKSKRLAMEKVSLLEVNDGIIVCRDFLGRSVQIEAQLQRIDLENNIILSKKEND